MYSHDRLRELHIAIEKQQGKKYSTIWCVGEQLKEIVGTNERLIELVLADLDSKGMSLADCEKLIKAQADEHHKKNGGSCAAVSPKEAEEIIRKFYGLGEATDIKEQAETVGDTGDMVDLTAFF